MNKNIVELQQSNLIADCELKNIAHHIRNMQWSILYYKIYKKPTGFHSIEELKENAKKQSKKIKLMIKNYGIKNFFKSYKQLKESQVFEGLYLKGADSLVYRWLKEAEKEFKNK